MGFVPKELPKEWSVEHSRSQNRPYYFNKKNGQRIWKDDELPHGWAYDYDPLTREKFYFHLTDMQGTKTLDKPSATVHESKNALLDDAAHDSLELMSVPEILTPSVYQPSPKVQGAFNNKDLRGHQRVIDEPAIESYKQGPSAFSTKETAPMNSPKKRKLDHLHPVDTTVESSDHRVAAAFYDNLKRDSHEDRGNSLVYHLRAMNNWTKSILIKKFNRRGNVVLDLACGKGGDIMKWAREEVSAYVGVDIARQSLEDAIERIWSNNRLKRLDVRFAECDLGSANLRANDLECWNRRDSWHVGRLLAPTENFDMVSIQFALHYMFGEEVRAHTFFSGVRDLLKPGGYLIATTIDPNSVVQHLASACGNYEPDGSPSPIRILDAKQREACTIQFDSHVRERLLGYSNHFEGSSNSSLYGLRYNFTLRDSEEHGEAVDAPEYLIPNPLLESIADKFDFDIVLQSNFNDFFVSQVRDGELRTLLDRMHVLNYRGSFFDEEWALAGLYQVLALRRRMA